MNNEPGRKSVHVSNCQLEDLLEGLVPEDELLAIEEHLSECSECQADADAMFQAAAQLESWTAENHRRALVESRTMPAEARVAQLSLHAIGERLVRWLSPLWTPHFAGQPVTAADMASEEQTFYLDEGSIRLTCRWWAASEDQPAAFWIGWYANMTGPTDMWIRFSRSDDPAAVLAEKPLGSDLSGEAGWLSDELGFDPTRQPWALTLLITE